DQRVANSYYNELGSAGTESNSVLFPHSQDEVVKMKFCSNCKEAFAEQFSFCPVDGTPLNGQFTPPEIFSKPEPLVLNTPVVEEPVAPPASLLAADIAPNGSAAIAPRGEFHLTMIDDAGLVGRLSKELADVAHQYQLTWPEFKRDPFGFVKRSLLGYGQMAGKFFGNRNVMAGLIVAVIAMIALVGIISLLDRAQPGGISRSGFITFAAIALLILAGIFV